MCYIGLEMSGQHETELVAYLNEVAGDRPWLEPADEQLTSKLPLFLRDKYRIFRADLFGRKLYLAIQNRQADEASPAEYAQDVAALKQRLSGDVILVLTEIPAYVRNRMVRQHVPFIVPGTQMFLPMLMIDLREQYPKSTARPRTVLSSVAQLVVIYHLVREPLDDIPLGQIAGRLGYSAMALSKADDELQSADLCEVIRTGRSLSLHFKWDRRNLWTNAEPLLSTPVKRTQWIRWGQPRPRAAMAGVTALATYTMLADDSIPTFAMRDKNVVGAFERGEVFGCATRDDAEARMEAWRYDPLLLSKGDVADPCSLYLSLRHSADERAQKELTSLVNRFLQ